MSDNIESIINDLTGIGFMKRNENTRKFPETLKEQSFTLLPSTAGYLYLQFSIFKVNILYQNGKHLL